ncbi:MAG: hypothetical protein OXR66_07330 [Candidatus Woesearchaeota archaeon]|nr:hypothetical protein [Candidatus Woesearchaeota archaeon]
MVTIARTVEGLIQQKPFLQEALLKGIINYGALAELLQPEIEQHVQHKVQHAAVMMALRRLAARLKQAPVTKLEFTDESSIIAQDGLIEFTVHKTPAATEKIHKLLEKVETTKGDFLTVSHGVFEITLITHRKHLHWLEQQFTKDEIITVIDDLSALTLTIPLSFIDTPGFYYLVTRALAWENINIEEIVSTSKELTLIVKATDTPRAFTVLKTLTRNEAWTTSS